MKLKIIRYNEPLMLHECEDEKGMLHYVDLFVYGDLEGSDFEGIVGKVAEVDGLWPCTENAHGVKILEPEEQETENECG